MNSLMSLKACFWTLFVLVLAFYPIAMIPQCLGGDIPMINFDNSTLNVSGDGVDMKFNYRRRHEVKVESLNFYARKDGRDLYLASPSVLGLPSRIMAEDHGRISLFLPVPYLPSGDYKLIVKSVVIANESNRVLKSTSGRSLIQLAGYKGSNYELRCRLAGDVAPFVRGQDGLTQMSGSWRFYYSTGFQTETMSIMSFNDGKWADLSQSGKCGPVGNDGWRTFVMRCHGNNLELELDGNKISCRDTKSLFSNGFAGFRSGDHSLAYVDDIVVKDIDSGKIIISDDFERETIGNAWTVCGGSWEISRGIPVSEEKCLGSLHVPEQVKVELPKVEIKRRGDGIDFFVESKQRTPLFFSIAASSGSPYAESTYNVLRDTYNSGIRFFAPIVTIKTFNKDGHMDMRLLDDMMAQLLAAAPESYFLLRLAIPAPPALPASEKFHVVRKQGGEAALAGYEDTKIETSYDASLASARYKEYAAEEMKMIIGHFKSQGYGRRVLGVLVTGGGYELNWGQPGPRPDYKIDASPAQIKFFGDYLRRKYSTVEALRKAWGVPAADFDNPHLPDIEERSVSDFAGFKDPSKPESRRILDFLEVYPHEGEDIALSIFDSVQAEAPNSFFGLFDLFSLNTEWATISPGVCVSDKFPILRHPAPKFIGGIFSYHDRMAGGVSACTTVPWASVRMHGKMMLQEVDMVTQYNKGNVSELCYEDAAASMRREFANTFMIEHNAMWYFDMGYTGPWFNKPILLDEISIQLRVGDSALGLERKNTSEVLVVLDLHSLKYSGVSVKQLAPGENPPFYSIENVMNYSTLVIESMMRMGAPKDFIMKEDFPTKNGYKLYIFPTLFYCDDDDRLRIRKLVEEGAVCLIMGPAGLIDDKSASLSNMERLLGIKVKVDGPQMLNAFMIKSANPLSDGLSGKETIGGGSYRDALDKQFIPYWHRFFLDDTVPQDGLEILAKYPDGKPAMGVKRIGKGAIIYSAVPLTHPMVYRNVAKFAGVHVYLDTDDALYADGNFILVHTKDAGKKKLKLRVKAHEIREVFSGDVIGRDLDEFEVDLPGKRTMLYYIGNDSTFLKRLDMNERR